ncbi:MotA/TolQ/ExbB proton channel family protein [Francisella sp. LA112445]|uniref:MotA/TolQ/ExbB proton channel family protein n=1 Tax=Francisella sp. LA112445 TaxID=1395624 RepID=UPI001788C570|nr:MotA/TolQ/ExbB proton channel family protein [Francisella sp. LA112445]QIW10984.1 MotA/TolQ/ExbB proton channel family protein [Francisella sp. LA112445]
MISYFLSQFGLVGYLMLLVSLILTAICIERCITFIFLPRFKSLQIESLITLAGQGDSDAIKNRIDNTSSKLSKYIAPLLLESKDIAENAVSIMMRKERQRLQQPLVWLNFFAVVSPMLGLLGTIWSMSHSFKALAESLNGSGLEHMILYLSEAMYATALGIILALFSMFTFYCFRHYSESYLFRAEEVLNDLALGLERQKIANKTQYLTDNLYVKKQA